MSISNRELDDQISKICVKISDVKQNWKEREAAIEAIRRIVAEGTDHLESRIEIFHRLATPLARQAADLRSQISKLACLAIGELANELGNDFHGIAEVVCTPLLKVSVVKKKVVSDSSINCLHSIIRSSREGFSRMLPKIIEGCHDKSPCIRSVATRLIGITLEEWNWHGGIEKFSDPMRKLIKQLLEDANGDVRKTARCTFWSFHDKSPVLAKQIQNDISPSTLKALIDSNRGALSGRSNVRDTTSRPLLRVNTAPNGTEMNAFKRENCNTIPKREPERRRIPSPRTRVLQRRQQSARQLTHRPRTATASTVKTELSTNSRVRQRSTSAASGHIEGFDLTFCLRTAESKNWEDRMSAINLIASNLESLSSIALEKAIRCILGHMNDNHHKVSVCAMQALALCVKCRPRELEQFVGEILSKVLQRANDPKHILRKEGASLFDLLKSSFHPDIICSHLHTVLEQPNAKLQQDVLDLLLEMVADSRAFEKTMIMKQLLHRLAIMLKPGSRHRAPPSVQAGAVRVLKTFVRTFSQSFSSAVTLLSMDQQTTLKKSIGHEFDMLMMEFDPRGAEIEQNPIDIEIKMELGDDMKEFDSDNPAMIPPVPPPMPTDTRSLTRLTVESGTQSHNNRHFPFDKSLHSSSHSSILINHNNAEFYENLRLLNDSSFADEQRRVLALHSITKIAKGETKGSDYIWDHHFAEILRAVLNNTNSSEAVSEQALRCLKHMIRSQSPRFEEMVEVALRHLLVVFRDNGQNLRHSSETCLDEMINQLNPLDLWKALSYPLQSERDGVLQATIRALGKVAQKIPKDLLIEKIDGVIHHIFRAFDDESMDIRKAVVFCLVDLYMVLGDQFTPFLARLTTAKLKLVTIYIDRSMDHRKQ
eukprot:TRINITY_DN6793_c0_g1_i1.p1 TRINITY_DN6793_c0_g1~~TRINITY_DN6793_c0_g1_i1.p1  ORF type:complete len:879 (-),score=177.26 TRINITY_DN6793_c0_g1_i1:498-3134(-)